MRWLVNYLRQCFCAHEFEKEETWASKGREGTDDGYKEGIKVSLLCKKCGYHKSFWKF